MLLHNDRMRESCTTLKILSYTTMLLYRHISVYENLVLPRSLVPYRSEAHNSLYYTTTVHQPCCCTMNVYENPAPRYIQDLVIRSPYSNRVAVQWDVHGNLALPRGALSQRSA